MENSNFLKVGEKIMFKPKTSGLDYNLESGKVYTITIDRYSDEVEFNIAPNIELPEKLYSTVDDDKFITKVLHHHSTTSKNITGVMLAGLKGSGKTIMMKRIAVQSKLPIILIDKGFSPRNLVNLFNKLADTEVCVLMDEIDKLGDDYDNDYLLRILDGINSSGKKLFVFTCNDADDISEYMIDRCSRIRYWKEFDELPISMIQTILEDRLEDKSEVNPLTDFIQENFKCASFDNIASFVEEVNAYPNETFEALFNDMNLSNK